MVFIDKNIKKVLFSLSVALAFASCHAMDKGKEWSVFGDDFKSSGEAQAVPVVGPVGQQQQGPARPGFEVKKPRPVRPGRGTQPPDGMLRQVCPDATVYIEKTLADHADHADHGEKPFSDDALRKYCKQLKQEALIVNCSEPCKQILAPHIETISGVQRVAKKDSPYGFLCNSGAVISCNDVSYYAVWAQQLGCEFEGGTRESFVGRRVVAYGMPAMLPTVAAERAREALVAWHQYLFNNSQPSVGGSVICTLLANTPKRVPAETSCAARLISILPKDPELVNQLRVAAHGVVVPPLQCALDCGDFMAARVMVACPWLDIYWVENGLSYIDLMCQAAGKHELFKESIEPITDDERMAFAMVKCLINKYTTQYLTGMAECLTGRGFVVAVLGAIRAELRSRGASVGGCSWTVTAGK